MVERRDCFGFIAKSVLPQVNTSERGEALTPHCCKLDSSLTVGRGTQEAAAGLLGRCCAVSVCVPARAGQGLLQEYNFFDI